LKDKAEFERVHNGNYFIEWDCGADLSADTIQSHWVVMHTDHAQQNVPADSANTPPLS